MRKLISVSNQPLKKERFEQCEWKCRTSQ